MVESWVGWNVDHNSYKRVQSLLCFFKIPPELLIDYIQEWRKCIYQWCKCFWGYKYLQDLIHLYYFICWWWWSKENTSRYWLSHLPKAQFIDFPMKVPKFFTLSSYRGVAHQSYTCNTWDTSLSIDVNENGKSYVGGSIAHTTSETNPCCKVELGGMFTIACVYIYRCGDSFVHWTI